MVLTLQCLTAKTQPVTGFLLRSLFYAARHCIVAVTAYLDCHGLRLLEVAARRGVKVVVFYDKLRCNKTSKLIKLLHERNHFKHYMADGLFYVRATSNLTWGELEGSSLNTAELEVVSEPEEAPHCRVASEVLTVICSMLAAHPEARDALRGTPCLGAINQYC